MVGKGLSFVWASPHLVLSGPVPNHSVSPSLRTRGLRQPRMIPDAVGCSRCGWGALPSYSSMPVQPWASPESAGPASTQDSVLASSAEGPARFGTPWLGHCAYAGGFRVCALRETSDPVLISLLREAPSDLQCRRRLPSSNVSRPSPPCSPCSSPTSGPPQIQLDSPFPDHLQCLISPGAGPSSAPSLMAP